MAKQSRQNSLGMASHRRQCGCLRHGGKSVEHHGRVSDKGRKVDSEQTMEDHEFSSCLIKYKPYLLILLFVR
jgi:hypothetical protein